MRRADAAARQQLHGIVQDADPDRHAARR